MLWFRKSSAAKTMPQARPAPSREAESSEDRRRFPRVKAPIYFRSPRLRAIKREVLDISLGGMRVYSDEPFHVDDQLTVELFLPDGASVSCLARVAWQRPLPEGSPAVYDVGLELLEAPSEGLERLGQVLERDA